MFNLFGGYCNSIVWPVHQTDIWYPVPAKQQSLLFIWFPMDNPAHGIPWKLRIYRQQQVEELIYIYQVQEDVYACICIYIYKRGRFWEGDHIYIYHDISKIKWRTNHQPTGADRRFPQSFPMGYPRRPRHFRTSLSSLVHIECLVWYLVAHPT